MRIREGLNESLLRDPGQSKDFFLLEGGERNWQSQKNVRKL